MKLKMYDVAVIGAGVVGALTARELSRYSLSVCLIEKGNDVAGGATRANSGIVHAGFDAETGTLKARLNVKGARLMPALAAELGVHYRQNGSLVVGYNAADRTEIQTLYERGLANGVENLAILDIELLQKIEPALSKKAICALYAPTAGVICPFGLAIAATGNAMDNGADCLLNYEVTELLREADGFRISGSGAPISARFVVNAAGVFSDKIARLIGDDSFRLRPRRGEYMLLDKVCGNLLNHTVFFTPDEKGKGVLVSPTADGNLLLGPTSSFVTGKSDTATTAEGLEQILAEAYRQVPELPAGKVITSFAGLRAVGDTGDFIINSPVPGFVNAAGIESPGLTASPAIARYIVNLLAENGLALREKPDFNPIRPALGGFREKTAEEQNAVIRVNPRYGNVICRCEQVSEGEILEALTRNPIAHDTDGIKRRVRAGMGRCQGEFCLPSVAAVLAEELGIPFEAVTKSGAGSKVNLRRTKGNAD
ncbi:MAG: NAD(P)/FAD-dependent oxidoreductase [Oscillospiraceae bacterium]|jgi:glycerol-3-phosphate dehydrogenase|nr:NAD(P)/FAD-dependent oxidoreductase [Oscillospiraceae bacterium]